MIKGDRQKIAFDKRYVAGSVILYNSKEQVIQNIFSYIDQVSHLFIIDNSDVPNKQLIDIIHSFDKTTYISNNGNKGVAYALNQAAEAALRGGYYFLLTMDDDSQAPIGMVDSMLQFINNQNVSRLGIVGVQSIPKLVSESVSLVWSTITSGSLLNMNAYVTCGSFLESLFIDWVDHEYCFRLITHGYQIFEINYLALDHKLGHTKQVYLFGQLIRKWPSHDIMRMYYKMRNGLYVLQLYRHILPRKVKKFFYRTLFTDIINVIFFENHKFNRLKFVIRGMLDYQQKRLGKFTRERN